MATLEVQVAASSDDALYNYVATSLSLTDVSNGFGNFDASNRWACSMRFDNITIPKDANITAAYLKMTARLSQAGTTVNGSIVVEASDDAVTYSTVGDWLGRAAVPGNVLWNPGSWVASTVYNSPDFASLIQPVINRAGWVSGNAIGIKIGEIASDAGANRNAVSWDLASGTDAPILHLEYDVPGQFITMAGSMITTGFGVIKK